MALPEGQYALEMAGVVKRYGRRNALDGLDLSIPRGSVCGLVGSNGAGKTTAMGVAVGLLRCGRGEVNLLGAGPFRTASHAGKVALLPQDTDLPLQCRVTEILVYYAELQGMSRPEARRAASEATEWVHLADRADSKISSLSHGMRRRLLIAQAFLGDPELVLLDEPLSGLDPKEVVNIRGLLRRHGNERTIVISSHNLHEIERVCDHVVFIEKGRRVRQDSMAVVTGQEHVLSYRCGRGGPPLDAIRGRLPSVVIETGDEGTFVCRYTEADGTAAAVNAAVLQCLLDARVEILEVRQGSELESAYLAQGRQTGPGDG